MDKGRIPDFPFVVQHARTNKIGVATLLRYQRKLPYFDVQHIKERVGPCEKTYSTWSIGLCLFRPDLTPEELGYAKKLRFRMPVRNTLTGAVGIAVSSTFQNRIPAYSIEWPDGIKRSRWLKKYTVEITQEEYDSCDISVSTRPWNSGAKLPKLKANGSGHDRKCKMCKKPCWPNWFYCPECHQIVSAGHDWSPENDGSRAGL